MRASGEFEGNDGVEGLASKGLPLGVRVVEGGVPVGPLGPTKDVETAE